MQPKKFLSHHLTNKRKQIIFLKAVFHFYIHQKSKCVRQNNFSRGMRNKTIFQEAANENELMRFAKKCVKK